MEDHEDSLRLLQAMLSDEFDVAGFSTGKEFLKNIKEVRPHLVLLDIALTELDGIAIIRKIRSDKKLHDLPVIAVTAYAMKEEHNRFLRAGFSEHVTKPVMEEELLRAIRRWLTPQAAHQ